MTQPPDRATPPPYPEAPAPAATPSYPHHPDSPPPYPHRPPSPAAPPGPPHSSAPLPHPTAPGAVSTSQQATCPAEQPEYTPYTATGGAPHLRQPPPPYPPVLEASPAPPHPHHIDTDPRRVHLARHQRGADATAIGNLLLYLPNFLCSLVVMSLVTVPFGGVGLIILLAWLLSGALVFYRRAEAFLAHRLLKMRHPTPAERTKLEPVWREVTTRAGVDARTYDLWVEDSEELNAVAAAGHIVGVTRFSLDRLPNGELAAVMAHELGHHVGGHAWSSLLGYWYALPGRLFWRVLRCAALVSVRLSAAFGCFGPAFLLIVFGSFAFIAVSSLYGLPLLILLIPYLLAYIGRRAELRADQHAAALGFGPMLVSVLQHLHAAEQRRTAESTARNGGVPPRAGRLGKLLSSHPEHHIRVQRLIPYLDPTR